ncbi:MAG TPA: tRNA (cytidine(34)-2'-O)-methyltransferase [Polyangiaceae bacterium]|nr:tRNA (cytidine(34)-2'-O)-methyltransferase [Polyangiaceae bacterium]
MTSTPPRPPLVDNDFRLRAPARETPFHVVLVEPEIPPNTGNVARLCAATCARMHLVHPLGFQVDEKAVRRAGLDYWHLVDWTEHPNFAACDAARPSGARRWFFTGKATRSFLDVSYSLGDYLVFGKESVGLDLDQVGAQPDELVAIPTLGAVRSLNLANAVALALYEGLRQNGCLTPNAAG